MARTRKPKAPTEVEAYTHDERRANIPTADAHDLITPEVEEVVEVSYPREIYSPMLVWKGKEALDDQDLQVDAPPIYIQEKVDPRVLIENLRDTAKAGELEPELTLFESFDGLSELDLVEFYRHSANWSNRMILGDSLQVMASLAERERLRGKVQMIYIDPPYGIKFGSNWQVSARKRGVKDGKAEDIAREAEQVKAFRDTWELGIHSYLAYLRDRLEVTRDLLTESGSVFLQIGDENVHLVRALLDEVFGSENFAGRIALTKTSSQNTVGIQSVFDEILIYARNIDQMKVRDLARPKKPGERGAKQYTTLFSKDLTERRRMTARETVGLEPLPEGWRIGRLGPTLSQEFQQGPRSEAYTWDDEAIPCPSNSHWKYDPTPGGGMDRLRSIGRLQRSGRGVATVLLLDDNPTTPLDNIWLDTGTGSFTEDQVYVVQTSAKAVQRCVLMSTDPGDLVLDPTCGSGTTAYVAEQWGRRWITIDTSRVALALARQRLMGARYPYYLMLDSAEGRQKETELSVRPLPPFEPSNDLRHGFVYERVPHITLGSIANNPDIKEGMSRDEIDAAIAQHADLELLYDRPFEDKSKVRVSGPFTVESLSPHRQIDTSIVPDEPTENQAADDSQFEQTILENLRAAGIQNGRKAERLEFDLVESYAGKYVQAVGIREEAPKDAPSRVGVAIGPQYGTVSPSFVKQAAREASKDKDLDLLCIVAFAFDPQVLNVDEDYVATAESFDVAGTRSLGRIPVLLVRMNVDLLMGEELKKTGAGNLFTVFGEPDITIAEDGDDLVVELNGVDVYDPTTGEVRSDSTDKVALWMIDTDYDGESFFVRHCYFTGGQDPYKRLKRSLKADIDKEGWESLYRTSSRPFPKPSTGKIAVKVINDYGDEVLTAYEVP